LHRLKSGTAHQTPFRRETHCEPGNALAARAGEPMTLAARQKRDDLPIPPHGGQQTQRS